MSLSGQTTGLYSKLHTKLQISSSDHMIDFWRGNLDQKNTGFPCAELQQSGATMKPVVWSFVAVKVTLCP